MTSIAALPKVELHRHLEGSVRFATFLDLAKEAGIEVPRGVAAARRMVQVAAKDPRTLPSFLTKFEPLRSLYANREGIERVAREAVEDAIADGVVYLELRFSPVHFARRMGADPVKVAGWIIRAARKAAKGIEVNFIITFGRDRGVEVNKPSMQAALDYAGDVVGIDLAGDERSPAAPFGKYFRDARKAGLKLTIHAGEAGPASNIRQAIEEWGAERIGHGVRVIEDPAVLALAEERGVTFEMAPTSNIQTGAVGRWGDHPFRSMLRAGQRVTINTDDPAISGVTLRHEFGVVLEKLGGTVADLAQATINAARGAFVDDPEALADRVGRAWAALKSAPRGVKSGSRG